MGAGGSIWVLYSSQKQCDPQELGGGWADGLLPNTDMLLLLSQILPVW